MLAEAGVSNLKTDLWYMPVQRPYNPDAKKMAELMQADLAKVGVTAELKTFEWGEYRKRLQAGEHQMGMLGWTGDNGDPDNFMGVLLSCGSAREGGQNVAKWCNEGLHQADRRGQADLRRGEAHRALQAGAGDLPRRGAVGADRALGRLACR